jgi:hypothetical protein
MPAMSRPRPVLSGWPALLLAALVIAGCARPYSGPKTLAAIGAGLLIGGSALWIGGERTGRQGLVTSGFATALVGAGTIAGAAAWLAASSSCQIDRDCPDGEECKGVPAPPGGIPYRQCRRR